MKPRLAAAAALITVALAACDAPVVTAETRAFTDADWTAILETLRLSADAQGQVMNECGDRVTPQFLPAELGGRVGTAILFAIGGGPTMASCYGDGPDLHLFMRQAAGWREIYSARGRMLIILKTSTGGVRDIADGGPGFSFPVLAWDGSVYARTDREVSDADLKKLEATYLP